MRFGTKVIVERGGDRAAPGTRGCNRFVRGILVGACGLDYRVRLTEDDPLDTVGRNKKGMIGTWGQDAVKERA